MGEYDRQHRVKLAVDDWGAWCGPGSEVHPTHNPRAVEPRDETARVNGGTMVFRFAPASVTRLQLALA